MRRVQLADASFPPWTLRASRKRFFLNKVYFEGNLRGGSNSFGGGQPSGRNRLRRNGSGIFSCRSALEFLELRERFLPVLLDPGQFGFFLSDPTADGFGIRHGSGEISTEYQGWTSTPPRRNDAIRLPVWAARIRRRLSTSLYSSRISSVRMRSKERFL